MLVKSSGQIYERSLIEKYIATHNKCPITGEPLSVDDLIAINGSKIVKPRPAGATSIPGMLQLFQNEWDSQMLETYNLKQQLDAVRCRRRRHASMGPTARLLHRREMLHLDRSVNSMRSFNVRNTPCLVGACVDSPRAGSCLVPKRCGASCDRAFDS